MRQTDLYRSGKPTEPKLFRVARQEHHRICNSACVELPELGPTSAMVHTITVENAGFELAPVQWGAPPRTSRSAGPRSSDHRQQRANCTARHDELSPIASRVASRGVLPRERFSPLEERLTCADRDGAKPRDKTGTH